MLIDFVNRASIFLLSLSPRTMAEKPQLNAGEQNPKVIDCNILFCSDGSFRTFFDKAFKGLEFDLVCVICWFVGFMTTFGLIPKMNHDRNYVCACVMWHFVFLKRKMDIFNYSFQ